MKVEDMNKQLLSRREFMDFARRSAHRSPPSAQPLRHYQVHRLLPRPLARLQIVSDV
jgi:hypothetical protein